MCQCGIVRFSPKLRIQQFSRVETRVVDERRDETPARRARLAVDLHIPGLLDVLARFTLDASMRRLVAVLSDCVCVQTGERRQHPTPRSRLGYSLSPLHTPASRVARRQRGPPAAGPGVGGGTRPSHGHAWRPVVARASWALRFGPSRAVRWRARRMWVRSRPASLATWSPRGVDRNSHGNFSSAYQV